MKTINLKVYKQEYEQRITAARLGHAYSVRDNQNVKYSRQSISEFDAIDSALLEVLKRSSHGYYEVEVTVSDATISEDLQAFLIDKYSGEHSINSVTFE